MGHPRFAFSSNRSDLRAEGWFTSQTFHKIL